MTIATMHSHQAHQLLSARGPFASIYFDDSHDANDGAARLEVRWCDVAKELEDRGAEAALVSLLERAVLGAKPPVVRGGHGLIATADGVLIDEHLVVAPPSQVVRVSDLPYVVPLIECGPVWPTYMVVAVDHVGAELILYHGNSVLTETVDAGGYPVHKVANAENYGWGAQEHRVEEAIRKNVRAVADALSGHCDRALPEVVFVIGQDRVRAELMLALPERVKVRVVRPRVGARNTGVDDTVCRAIALEFQSRRLAVATEWARQYHAEAGRQSGVAVDGLTAVCAGLREDAVATLIVGDLANETVLAGDAPTMVATDADALSAFGVPPTRTLRADEAIPYAAIAGGANLVCADDSLNARDGVAALLRHAAVAPLGDGTFWHE
jgi:peptide chain release factor subunit 1